MLFNRRPSLSQQPPASHVVIAAGRESTNGGVGGESEGLGRIAVREPMWVGGTVIGGSGAPDRSAPAGADPRQAVTALFRACANCSRAPAVPPLASLIADSRLTWAAAQAAERNGSADCAPENSEIPERVSSKKVFFNRRARRMVVGSIAQDSSGSALSGWSRPCLTCAALRIALRWLNGTQERHQTRQG
jgi:hypothetical protein